MRFTKPTIMVVDDESEIRDSFAIILEDKCNLAMAESGEEALATLRNRTDIHMVFLDYRLPGMNGLEFLEALQQHRIHIPVVMVTGRGTREIAARAFQFEAEDYITKPFRVKEIQDTVDRVLRRNRKRRTPLVVAKQLIEKNMNKTLTTQEIAHSSGSGYRKLVNQFKVQTGMTIVKFRNARRVELAKKYLRENDWSMEDIASAVGFNRQNYFSYVFRELAGSTPTAYRKQFR